MFSKIDHIGIAVNNLAEAVVLYEEIFQLKGEEIEEVPSQQVRVKKFAIGETRLELLEPTAETSPIAQFLTRRGEGLHHIAYGVVQFDQSLEKIRAAGLQIIGQPTTGAEDKRVVFIHPKSTFGVLIELVEIHESDTSK